MQELFEKNVKTEEYMLHILYKGEPVEEDIDTEKLNILINDIFDAKKFDLNVVKIIYTMRKILQQYDENYLLVELKDFNDNEYTKVVIKNKKVTTYVKNSPISLYKIGSVMAELKCSNEGLDIHIPNQFDSMANLFRDEVSIQNYINHVFENIDGINEMKNINGLYLDREEKKVIDVYRWFFGENPNFRSEVTVDRIHQIVYLLKMYGMDTIENIFDFKILGLDGPHSDTLQKIVDRLTIFEEISSYGGSSLRRPQEEINKIITLGSTIRKFGETTDNYMDATLLHICNILFIMKNDFPNKSVDFITSSAYVDCDKEIAKSIIGLLDVIEEYMSGKIESNQKHELPYPLLFGSYPAFNVETDWKSVATGGFVEEYCLSDEEQKRLRYLREQHRVE